MAGIASRPMSTTTAPTIPEAMPQSAQTIMVATASEPGMPPMASWSARNMRSRMLARSMM